MRGVGGWLEQNTAWCTATRKGLLKVWEKVFSFFFFLSTSDMYGSPDRQVGGKNDNHMFLNRERKSVFETEEVLAADKDPIFTLCIWS